MTDSAALFANHKGAAPLTRDAPRQAMGAMHATHARQIVDDRIAQLGHVPLYAVRYLLHGRPGITTPEPAEGAMKDRLTLQGLGATNIEVMEVRK